MKRSYSFALRTGFVARSFAVAALAAMGACSSAPPLFLPDGRATTLVQCPNGSDSCQQQARAKCGGDYDVIQQSTENGTISLIYACRAK
ncbi:hypothetical protein [Paraburkholderia sp.]|uniref:hypothetical protein n=1 Tax=Paraburkholderia sp. TaxID=1926495 RepID=UPI0023846045|nr:hypothetical protein [Paraburkholderia sp.]MDE1180334.1 hypothetical protein [Paraburkholderia sp.]